MNRNLLILGAGQYGAVAKEIAVSMGCFEKIDFLDDRNNIAIDAIGNYEKYARSYSDAIVAIGKADVRLCYIPKLEAAGFRIASLVSPSAYVASSARIRKGSIIGPMAVVHTNATVEEGSIVCAGAIVNHDATIGTGCLLQCGSIVAAGAVVKKKTTLDYGEILKDPHTSSESSVPVSDKH